MLHVHVCRENLVDMYKTNTHTHIYIYICICMQNIDTRKFMCVFGTVDDCRK